MADKIVVGHQPQYMPYLGVLNKISKADVFIIVDHVQYVRKYFYNRTLIKINNEAQLLTIPVYTKGMYEAPISNIKISYDMDWIRKHLKSIKLGYSASPHFNDYYPTVEHILQKRHVYLAELTSELLLFFINEFNLVKDVRFSSAMNISGHKTELLIDLTKAVGGNIYISGDGARDYFDEECFRRSGLKHIFTNFKHPSYPQQGHQMLEGMGCIDLLFNCGKEGRKYIVNPEVYLK